MFMCNKINKAGNHFTNMLYANPLLKYIYLDHHPPKQMDWKGKAHYFNFIVEIIQADYLLIQVK